MTRRTRPDKFIDAGVLSPELAGIKMPSVDCTVEQVSTPGLVLQYDEVHSGMYSRSNVLSSLFMTYLRLRSDICFVSDRVRCTGASEGDLGTSYSSRCFSFYLLCF